MGAERILVSLFSVLLLVVVDGGKLFPDGCCGHLKALLT